MGIYLYGKVYLAFGWQYLSGRDINKLAVVLLGEEKWNHTLMGKKVFIFTSTMEGAPGQNIQAS
jgi:hypothetical protein